MQHEPITPCPFCAGVGVAFTRDDQTGGPFNAASLAASEEGVCVTAFVFCHECGAKGPPVEDEIYIAEQVPQLEAKAVRLWNGRAA
ncbi:Lar family restriction alleviation protein [Aeromonas salmonicida]|uniref:Lar family restriction alleviation protein n=1 Tax=Aeromonas salmonicida TaxID=645 RepID=UPI0030D395F1